MDFCSTNRLYFLAFSPHTDSNCPLSDKSSRASPRFPHLIHVFAYPFKIVANIYIQVFPSKCFNQLSTSHPNICISYLIQIFHPNICIQMFYFLFISSKYLHISSSVLFFIHLIQIFAHLFQIFASKYVTQIYTSHLNICISLPNISSHSNISTRYFQISSKYLQISSSAFLNIFGT